MARLLKHPRAADTKLVCGGTNTTEIPVHSSVIIARSNVLADMIVPLVESEPETKAAGSQVEAAAESATEPETEDKKVNGATDVRFKYPTKADAKND